MGQFSAILGPIAKKQVQAKGLHGPLLLRVLGASKIAWVGWVKKDGAGNISKRFLGCQNFSYMENRGNMVILPFSMFVCQKMNRLNSGGESEQKSGITEN